MTSSIHQPVLAFCLFRYFPHGGLERDMMAIAIRCHQRGCAIRVYTQSWQGDRPGWMDIRLLTCRAWTNHGKARRFAEQVVRCLASDPADLVVGFNKMPGLDVYYAADGCYAARIAAGRSCMVRMTGRYRQYRAFEEAVFEPASRTQVLVISQPQAELFVQTYGTQRQRLHPLPPNVSRDRRPGPDAGAIRASLRREFGLAASDPLMLAIGSKFITKGVDRVIRALASLDAELRRRTLLLVVGGDSPAPMTRLARRLGVAGQVRFVGARDDVVRFLAGSDLLLHPARHENTGTVIVEALAAGLPSIVSGTCGYASYVEKAVAGWVLPEPFCQEALNRLLAEAVAGDLLPRYRQNALGFAASHDLYGMADEAVAVIQRILADKQATALAGPQGPQEVAAGRG
jgi:UDP-glucose:(heptosyl)LPS alpha-1,3-glucosyltransferase